MARTLKIALVGGGIGGLTAALALARAGFEVHVFEQAERMREVGAGIGISPNAVKVLRALGLEDALRTRGFEPEAVVGRNWTSGEIQFRVPVREMTAARYGAPLVNIHRGDLLDILAAPAARECAIHLGCGCTAVALSDRSAGLTLSDGRHETFDLIVGCDGIHSSVRTSIAGMSAPPRFTGNMCWRALISVDRVPARHLAPNATLWTGPGGHIVTYYVRGGALINIVAIRETGEWAEESWSMPAETRELVSAFPDVHAELRLLLERAAHCFKWGLFDRDPLPTWTSGRITLLGDAAHPMLPFLGQGAAMAIEDGCVLARALAQSPADIATALHAYEAERIPRTTRVQLAARTQADVLHRSVGTPDFRPDWLYSYDPTGLCASAAPRVSALPA